MSGTYEHDRLAPSKSPSNSVARRITIARIEALIEACPELPEPVRAGISAFVAAARAPSQLDPRLTQLVDDLLRQEPYPSHA